MVRVIFCLFSVLLSLNTYALTKVTASIDKNPVVVNESVVLTVVADDDVNTNALDTSALLKDFIVGRTSVSSQTSMVNFSTSRTTTWTTVLIPRREGNILIPALSVEKHQTQPISVNVLKATDMPANAQPNLFITSQVSATEIYVQQQITLTVKLHFSAELKRGSLTEPTLAGANILQVGKDKENESIINGKRYRIIERIYAVSPQQSGKVVLKSPVFSGEIIQSSSRRSNFLSFANSKPVSVVGDDVMLNVKAIPDSVSGVWLPSELLALHQEWQPTPDNFKVGDPITRTITLTAAGLSEEQLPKILMNVPEGLKVYPDQAELHTGLNNERLVSQKVINFAIVASQAGEFTLPEISIPWWNTITNKQEFARIASQKITVQPNKEWTKSQIPSPTEAALSAAPTSNSEPKVIIKQSIWQWIFLALWLITLLSWYISAKGFPKRKLISATKKAKVNDSYLALMAACKQNDGQLVLTSLVPWAKSCCNNGQQQNITTIESIHALFDNDSLSQAIIELQQSYYGKEAANWQGSKLLAAIQQVNIQARTTNSAPDLAINP